MVHIIEFWLLDPTTFSASEESVERKGFMQRAYDLLECNMLTTFPIKGHPELLGWCDDEGMLKDAAARIGEIHGLHPSQPIFGRAIITASETTPSGHTQGVDVAGLTVSLQDIIHPAFMLRPILPGSRGMMEKGSITVKKGKTR